MSCFQIFCLFLIATILSGFVPVDDYLPLEEILDRHAQAMGGRQAWEKLQTCAIYSTVNQQFKQHLFMKKPNKIKIVRKVHGGFVIKSFNGKSGWIQRNQRLKPMVEGEEKDMKEEADFYEEFMFAKEKNYKLLLEGVEVIGGKRTYKIRMEKTPQEIRYYYINGRTFLIDMVAEYSEDLPLSGVYFKTVFNDFRQVGGLTFPFEMKMLPGESQSIDIRVDSIKVNFPLEDAFFNLVRD